jgi:hypothetical protein
MHFFTGQVFKPKIAYKGQKLMILVNTKTNASTSKKIPNVPVKYNAAISGARVTLIVRSASPMFFFLFVVLFF